MLTLLAEWGDRSQIMTINLAAVDNPVSVALGGIVGHSICTGLAVLGSKALAKRIPERYVAIFGGVTFLLFALHNTFRFLYVNGYLSHVSQDSISTLKSPND